MKVWVGDSNTDEIKEVDYPGEGDPAHWGHWPRIGGWYSTDRLYLLKRLIEMRRARHDDLLESAKHFESLASAESAKIAQMVKDEYPSFNDKCGHCGTRVDLGDMRCRDCEQWY